jgi:ABC-type glycerol-3-phosphate transport system permease component
MGSWLRSVGLERTQQQQQHVPRKSFPWGRVMTYVVLSLGVVFAVIPFLWMFSASLMTTTEINLGRLVPSEPLFMNYPLAWETANFDQYLWNSTRITAITVTGLLLFGIPAAYAFARMKFFGRNTLFAVMLATMMIPDVVILIPNFLTVVWLGRLGQNLCGAPCAWINNWPSLTIPFMASAFNIFLLRQFFAQIPGELWDAAQIDGAGHLRFLIRVVVPLSKAPIMTAATFGFISSWNEFLWPFLVATSDAWRPVTVGLLKFANDDAPGEVHLQMAASVITILPILVLYFFTQRQFTESIVSSGVKG